MPVPRNRRVAAVTELRERSTRAANARKASTSLHEADVGMPVDFGPLGTPEMQRPAKRRHTLDREKGASADIEVDESTSEAVANSEAAAFMGTPRQQEKFTTKQVPEKQAVTEAADFEARSKKALSMIDISDGIEAKLERHPRLGGSILHKQDEMSATDVLLHHVDPKARLPQPRQSRKRKLIEATGLRSAKGGAITQTPIPVTNTTPIEPRLRSKDRVALVREAHLKELKKSPTTKVIDQIPLPRDFTTLLAKFRVLDDVLCLAHTISRRTFSAVKSAVEEKTKKSFSAADLGRIIAVAPDAFALDIVMVAGCQQIVIKSMPLGSDRAAQAQQLRPRALNFKKALRRRVQEYIAQLMKRAGGPVIDPEKVVNAPPRFNPEEVPPITPAMLPEVVRSSDESSKNVLHRPTISTQAEVASSTATPGMTTDPTSDAGAQSKSSALETLRARIREKARRLKEEQSRAPSAEAKYFRKQFEYLLADVIFFVWGLKPAGKNNRTVRLLGKVINELQLLNANYDKRTAEQLLRLLCTEIEQLSDGVEKWCWVRTLEEGETKAEYFAVHRNFDKKAVTAHISSRLDNLE